MESPSTEKAGAINDSQEVPGKDDKPLMGDGMRPVSRVLLLISILFTPFLFAVDITVPAVLLPRFIERFGEVDKLPWIIVAMELGAVGANLCWGKLFGTFDHKTLWFAAMLFFEVGSVVCGAASTMNALIVGRLLAGIGGNGLHIASMNLISNLTSNKERPMYIGLLGASWSLGVILGPLIGGGFASVSCTGWRWSFYINPCLAALFAPVYVFLLPPFDPQGDRSKIERAKELDYVGVVLFWGAFSTITMAISFAGLIYAWDSGQTIGLFCASGVLWILFVVQQGWSIGTTPEHRLFPAHLLRSVENCVLFLQVSLGLSILTIGIYFIPLYSEFVHGKSALAAGIGVLPLICLVIFFCLLQGTAVGKNGYYMPWYLVGGIFVIVGAALLRTLTPGSSDSKLYGYSSLLGVGIGSYSQASFAVALARNPPRETANVLSAMTCGQLSGLTIYYAITNAIFFNRAVSRITKILPGESTQRIQEAISGASLDGLLNVPTDQKNHVLQAVSLSISDVYDFVLAAGVLVVVLALFMKRTSFYRA